MIKNVSIIGMGALGLLYANAIAGAAGIDAVSFVMDSERVDKYKNTDFTINGRPVQFRLVSENDAAPADLLIVAVKYRAL